MPTNFIMPPALHNQIVVAAYRKRGLPGQIEAQGAALSAKHGGLVFTKAEIDAFTEIAKEAGVKLDVNSLKTVEL